MGKPSDVRAQGRKGKRRGGDVGRGERGRNVCACCLGSLSLARCYLAMAWLVLSPVSLTQTVRPNTVWNRTRIWIGFLNFCHEPKARLPVWRIVERRIAVMCASFHVSSVHACGAKIDVGVVGR